ncbi:MAG: lytic transglycosylase [Bradymonadales bacterium]|nr:MAG: lytic transglycosylase [Bradymonadales bacterium]
MRSIRLGIIVSFGLLGFLGTSEGFSQERLPYPRALFHKVEFWKKVYTQHPTSEGLLHDSEDLSIIYETVKLPRNGDRSIVNARRAEIRQAIQNILQKRGQNLTAFERRVLSRFPQYASRARLLQAADNIRFQLGQADRFREGIIQSGRYLPYIEQVIRDEGAPQFLKYLPHVESSFQRGAISKYGAAGLWQLMPRTGAQFLRVSYEVDERLDPWISSRAAIKYLMQNHRRLKEWPLAITAYNHGAGGISRAVQQLGTTDIAEIAFQYSSRSFGFASRNFYAQFLAAVQVAQDYQKYFGALEIQPPPLFEEIRLQSATYFREFSKRYRFSQKEFVELNPALRRPLIENRRPIPAGVVIRVPQGSQVDPLMVASLDQKILQDNLLRREASEKRIQSIVSKEIPKASSAISAPSTPAGSAGEPELPRLEEVATDSRFAPRDLVGDKAWVRVEINETISHLADWLGVSPQKLREWNGMDSRAQVRLGQRLVVQFTDSEPSRFQSLREDYHRKIREDFFAQHEVVSMLDYEVQVGENLWSLCFQKFDIPPWLLAQLNPEVILWDLKPGTKLKIPEIQRLMPGLVRAEDEEQME